MTLTQDGFLARLTLFYITRIEQENNFDDDFSEDIRTFIISYFRIKL